MTSEWRSVTLGDLETESGGVIQTGPFGSQLHMSDYMPDGTPVVMPTNIKDLRIDPTGIARVPAEHVARLSRHRLMPGDIISSRRGDVEKCALVSQNEAGWLCGTGCLLVRVGGPGADSRYLSYALSLPQTRTWISQHAIGATMPNLNTDVLREVPVNLPGMDEQRAIAATLGALDDKIDSNRRVIESAYALAEALYDSATRNCGTELYSKVMSVTMGSAFAGSFFCEPGEGRPLLRIRDLKTGTPQTWTTERRTDEIVIAPGDVVVGMDAEFRATLWLGSPALLNQRVCAFTAIPPVGRVFVLFALAPALAFQEQAKTGTTVIHLNKADIDRFFVPALSADDHRELTFRAEPLIELIVERAVENAQLAALRDALLPELLSGRVKVEVLPSAG